VAKAAALAAAHDLLDLREDLARALARLLELSFKADPGSAAKSALAEALDRLAHPDHELFLRASRHVQWEPVWGGRVDAAADLRAVARDDVSLRARVEAALEHRDDPELRRAWREFAG
jgi:hypothetical protein